MHQTHRHQIFNLSRCPQEDDNHRLMRQFQLEVTSDLIKSVSLEFNFCNSPNAFRRRQAMCWAQASICEYQLSSWVRMMFHDETFIRYIAYLSSAFHCNRPMESSACVLSPNPLASLASLTTSHWLVKLRVQLDPATSSCINSMHLLHRVFVS